MTAPVDLVVSKRGEIVDLQGDTVRSVEVRADRVTVKNGTVDGLSFPALAAPFYTLRATGPRFVTFDALTVRGARSKLALVRSTRLVSCHLELDGSSTDGVFCSWDPLTLAADVLIEFSTIARTGPPADPSQHSDGVQLAGGSNVLLRSCSIDVRWTPTGWVGNACVFARPKLGSIDELAVVDCGLFGGGYAIEARPGPGDLGELAVGSVRVQGNSFEGQSFGRCNVPPLYRSNAFEMDNA